MALYYDTLDFKRDHFEPISKKEWRILGRAQAKKPIKFIRFCSPNCQAYQEDYDRKAICIYACKDFIFDRHMIDTKEILVNLLFAVNTLNKYEGISIWIGEKYLRKFLGDSKVNKMLKEYNDLLETPELDLSEFMENDEMEEYKEVPQGLTDEQKHEILFRKFGPLTEEDITQEEE